MIGILYKATNRQTGATYIGVTVQSAKRRWSAHVTDANRGLDTVLCRARRPGPTLEQRAQISAKLKGRKLSPEHIANVVAAKRGRPRSAEAKAAISRAKRGKPGKPHSLETRQKMSLSHRLRRAQASDQ